MDDLVKRLRERNDLRMLTASMPPLPVKDWLCNEAADRIEQLEREKASWKGAYDGAVLALTERNKELEAALRDLLVAVTFKTPPRDFGEDNPCYEARVPIAFVDIARAALGEKKDGN